MALLVVYVVWGSTYFAIAVVIETLPPLLSAGLRFSVAGAVMLGALLLAARVRHERMVLERPSLAHWRSAFIVGALLLLGGNGGVVLAEQYIPSGTAAVLIATVPIWLAVFDALLMRRRPGALVITGLVAGIIGVAILVAPVEGIESLDPLGVGLVIAAAMSWAIGSLYARRAPLPRSQLLGTGMEMLAGGIVILIAGTLMGELGRADVSTFSLRSVIALGYLIVFGSLAAFTAYTWLLAHVPVSTVGTYAYVNPIVAVALGAVFLSEPITLPRIAATVVIIGAVVAMVSGRPRQVEESGPAPEAATLEPADGGTDPARSTLS
ncbi:MAG: EamA family transporter [Chloroflexi bacterium]|nr:EamA family transporter [Chloroflexota bacterium]